jgi:pilus assembly protein Flp/PilA
MSPEGKTMHWVLKLLREEDGPAAVEYAVMLALILAAIIASVASVGQGTGGMWSGNKAAFDSVGFGS